MSVFKNGQNDYQLDFSNRLSSRLEKLDGEKLSELSNYLQNKFRWLFTITADFPVLKTGFITQEEADSADKALHDAISGWLKGKTKLKSQPQTKSPVMFETKRDIYEELVGVLTHYEHPEDCDDYHDIDWKNVLYQMLVKIQNRWDDTITAEK